ncbi:disease resistance protein RML1B-like [Prosopis cineraria]|uniref:disease resistance protein RML1B-like n=1 Tax=Prosopis cineraria TaxID=364024 RepID=UPI0024105651|nr:disease resistance protein RML1B-like [Prosopis cineraria]
MFSSSGHLSKMHTLCLNRCASLANLPYKLADLRNLRKLQIMGCNKLASNLHFIFDGSRALEAVEVDDCSGLFELPDNIYLLASLRKLHLSSTNVKTLPVSIKHLLRLQRLELDDCKRLRSLPELPPSIRWLIASDCRSLKTVHLTSTIDDHQVEEGDEDAFICFNFTNCMKLDRDSIKSIEAKVLLEMNKATPIPNVSLAYPGNKLPEWFMYRTKQSSIVLDLSSIPQPWDGSFIFCAIVSKSLHFDEIKADCYIDRLHIGHATFSYTDELHGSFSYTAELFSDHVIFWKGSVETTIGERKTDTQSRTCHPLLEIKFRLIFDGEEYEDKSMEVKEYGFAQCQHLNVKTIFNK